jgi:hypothetical protein
MHFVKGQVPPVKGFWSLTMYDKDGFFVHNPINHYNMGDRSLALKNNPDGSLDIYISSKNPGQARVQMASCAGWTIYPTFAHVYSR